MLRKDYHHLTILDDAKQLEILEKEKAHLAHIIQKLTEEKSILEKEQENLRKQKTLLKSEHDLLIAQIKTLEEAKKDIKELSFEDRLGLIKLDDADEKILESSLFTCPIKLELFKNPVALNNDDRYLIDESSIPMLMKAKDEYGVDYYVHPFIPGYEVYEHDAKKKGAIIKKIYGKVTSFTPIPKIKEKIEAFVLQAEQKYYINETARINERQEQIRKELSSIENRESEILLEIEQLNQRIQSANTECTETKRHIHLLHEKIDTQKQIVFHKNQAAELENSISELVRIMQEEDKIEQSEIDKQLIPKILELETLHEIICGLQGESPSSKISSILQKNNLAVSPALLTQIIKFDSREKHKHLYLPNHLSFFKPVNNRLSSAGHQLGVGKQSQSADSLPKLRLRRGIEEVD